MSDKKLSYTGILHASVIVADVERSLAFYRDVLGLRIDRARPDLPFPGAWLHVGGQQIHLLQVTGADPEPDRPRYGGRDRHTAIGVDDLGALMARLRQAGVEYAESRSGQRIFCRDPDGNTLEFVQDD